MMEVIAAAAAAAAAETSERVLAAAGVQGLIQDQGKSIALSSHVVPIAQDSIASRCAGGSR